MENEIMDYEQNIEDDIGLNTYENINVKLWNPKSFGPLSVLFSFLPAAILYSLNYGRLGNTKKRNTSLLISILAFAGMMLLAFNIQQTFMRTVFYAANFVAAMFMNNEQSNMYKDHISRGGKKASFTVTIVICVSVLIAIIALLIYTINIPEEKIIFGKSELYYTENIQKSEAEKLGNYLTEEGFFDDSREVSVKIDKHSDTYKFSLIYAKEYLNDEEIEQSLKEMSILLSKDVFDNNIVDIVICNNTFKPIKTIPGQKPSEQDDGN